MSRNKRQNENSQLRKDDWEVLNDNDSKNDENINDLFKTASHQELQQRRIVKVPRPSTGRSSIGSTTISSGGNPFVSIQLAAEATPKPNRNPFASISLAAPATFANRDDEILSKGESKHNLNLVQKILKLSQSVLMSVTYDVFAPISFPSISFTAEELGQISSTPTTTTAKSTTITSTDSQSVAMPFQFNKTVVPNFSSSTSSFPTKPSSTTFTGFNFGTSTTANTNINQNEQNNMQPILPLNNGIGGFSFTPSTTVAISSIANKKPSNEEAGDEQEEFQKDEAEVAQREINEDEDTLLEVRVKHYKLVSTSEWKDFGVGVLRLMRSKANPQKCRMVLRTDKANPQ